ncbi:histidine kinase [Sulfurihydrogenibium azorense]|uniref:histidine kinase n=1 Tax=Sulfurihydrogenibium azorense TaxID=309806 RepID=UPI00391A01DF
MKILYVGKDKNSYEILNEVASLSQSEVIMVESLEDAKNYITTNRDIHGIIASPKVDNLPSLQLLSILKRDENLKDIPFIILGEDITKEDIEYYKAMGVTEVFEIPFNPLEVFLISTAALKDAKGEEVVKQILHEAKKDKSLFMKILELIKKLFGIKSE